MTIFQRKFEKNKNLKEHIFLVQTENADTAVSVDSLNKNHKDYLQRLYVLHKNKWSNCLIKIGGNIGSFKCHLMGFLRI